MTFRFSVLCPDEIRNLCSLRELLCSRAGRIIMMLAEEASTGMEIFLIEDDDAISMILAYSLEKESHPDQ